MKLLKSFKGMKLESSTVNAPSCTLFQINVKSFVVYRSINYLLVKTSQNECERKKKFYIKIKSSKKIEGRRYRQGE